MDNEDKKYIYVVKCNEFVKIGETKNPKRRIKNIQACNPIELHLIYCELHPAGTEREIHYRFDQFRHTGEWFRLTKEIIEYFDISDLKHIDLNSIKPLKKKLNEVDKLRNDARSRLIDIALKKNNGNRSKTARELGVDVRTIFRHLKRKE